MHIDPIPERCPECGSIPRWLLRICKTCGVEFWAASNQVKIGKGLYCGRKCGNVGRTRPRYSLAERFWSKVQKTETCWLWTASRQRFGYGYLHVREDPRHPNALAHRVSWELHFGPIPDGLHVLHKCDIGACVRPDHLFLGSPADNAVDMIDKGRASHRRGDDHPRTRLTETDVIAIREAANNGRTYADLAQQHSMTSAGIRSIVMRRTWKHI